MPNITTANTTLEYFDGFDDYSSAQATRYWNGETSAAISSGGTLGAYGALSNFSISAGNGRNSTASLRTTNVQNAVGITLGAQATRTVGVAFKPTSLPIGANQPCIISLIDASTAQLGLRLNNDGTLSVVKAPGQGNGGTVLGTSSLALSAGVYVYIEMTSVINSSTGSYAIDVNGVQWLTGASKNTQQTANASANVVLLGGFSGSQAITWDFDDFYSRSDGTFCGDCRVELKLPTGNGATNMFTPSTGTNWQNVDENPATDDTDYNFSAAASDIDLYTYPALTTTAGAVRAVLTSAVLRNDTAGSITACSEYRQSSTNYTGGTQSISATTYTAYVDIQGQDPATSATWTVGGVNSAQFGVKRLT